ncbi:MAG: hypothetical protein AB1714_26985 [Acidobacteriota bacterium]
MKIALGAGAAGHIAPMARNIAGGLAKGVSSRELGKMKRVGDTFSKIAAGIGRKLGEAGALGGGAGKIVAPRGQFPTIPRTGRTALTTRSFGPGHRNISLAGLGANVMNNVANLLRPGSEALQKLGDSLGSIQRTLGQLDRIGVSAPPLGETAGEVSAAMPHGRGQGRKALDHTARLEKNMVNVDAGNPDGMRQLRQIQQNLFKVSRMVQMTGELSKGLDESAMRIVRQIR